MEVLMAWSKKLLLISVLLYSSFSSIFGMRPTQNRISVWPFLKLGLAVGSVALASYYAYKYFNKKDTEPNPKPFSTTNTTQIPAFNTQSDPTEQTIDLTPVDCNGEISDKSIRSDSDESFDNIPCNKIQVKEPNKIMQEARKRLTKSPWFSSGVVTFDLGDESLAHIKYQFDDVEQINYETQKISLDSAIKSNYSQIHTAERHILINGKIFPAIQNSLNIDKKTLSDLAAF